MRDWVTPSFVVVVERRLCVVPAWLRMLLAVALRRWSAQLGREAARGGVDIVIVVLALRLGREGE